MCQKVGGYMVKPSRFGHPPATPLNIKSELVFLDPDTLEFKWKPGVVVKNRKASFTKSV